MITPPPLVRIPSIDTFEARPPIHISPSVVTVIPSGLTPADIRLAYNIPASLGFGTIAIITALNHPMLESDLAIFDANFSLASCTKKNGCLEIHQMASKTKSDSGWDLESALDSEWAHAVAPKAKLLIVESASAGGADLMKAVDYARKRIDVVSISISWGGGEFAGETKLDSHFVGIKHSIAFFASSGDDGTGASWPAVSPNVISVGGTSLSVSGKSGDKLFMSNGNLTGGSISEKAWNGSGGGVSAYEAEPLYQKIYSIPRALGKRAVPDVSYSADPAHGFSVYHNKKWYVVGGTSAGAPQWAALAALGLSGNPGDGNVNGVTLAKLYSDKAGTSSENYFRDIKSGSNGDCVYYCQARAHYDYVTGLGSPVTYRF